MSYLKIKLDQKGFNYIELILVIAIIGIFSTVAFTFINTNYRQRGDDMLALTRMESILSSAKFCVGNGFNLTSPDPGESICAGTKAIWPEIDDWIYNNDSEVDLSIPFDSFYYKITKGPKTIECTEEGCLGTSLSI